MLRLAHRTVIYIYIYDVIQRRRGQRQALGRTGYVRCHYLQVEIGDGFHFTIALPRKCHPAVNLEFPIFIPSRKNSHKVQ